MNIPNLLTLCRIILVPVFVIFLIDGAFGKALVVFLVASITDGLDGFLARVLKQKTILGAYMDPLADKALVITSFVTLSVLDVIPSWLAVIVISRDFVILFGICVLALMSISFEVRPAFVSKITTVFQFLTESGQCIQCSGGATASCRSYEDQRLSASPQRLRLFLCFSLHPLKAHFAPLL